MSLGLVTALSVRASVEGQARKPGPRVRLVGWPSYPRQGAIMRECSSARKAGAITACSCEVMTPTAKRAANLRISA
jgi:hypothetical protein